MNGKLDPTAERRSVPAERQPLALLGVLIPGALGLVVLARTLLFYLGQDGGAALLVVVMGAAMLVGLAELVLRTRRAAALEREIGALPEEPDEALIAKQSPLLRDLLRARIEGAPVPVRNEGVTSYLVGLLVMLGLLGTLLGLFETLGGAGHALTASTNVDALRTGLSGPVRGLTRSFGCSAAGVSASALLGLAAALVRRHESRVFTQLYSYANRALRDFSPLRSQANALAQLAAQGNALPQAAGALERVAQQLSGLSERWEVAHRAAAEAQQKSLEGALTNLRAELSKSAAAASRELESALSKQLTQLVRTTGELVSGHLKQTAEAMERELGARRSDDATLRQGLAADLVSVRDAVLESSRAQGALIESQIRELEQTLGQRATRANEQLESQRKQAEAHLASLTEASQALAQRLDEDARARRDESGRLHDALAQRLDQAGSKLGQIADQVGDQLSARLASEHDLGAQLSAAMAQFERSGRALEDAVARQEGAVTQLVGEARSQLAETSATAQRGLTQVLELAQQGFSETSGAVQAGLVRTAESAQRSLAETAELAQQGLTQALEAAQLGMTQAGVAAREGAQTALERVVALAGEQSERLVQLEQQLEAAQAQHAAGLSERLGAQAERLGQGLETTTALVQQAAELLKASSVEMGAVAEMFAASVERQREAASSWLESLGELEGAVERAGRGAAADALGDQLASTQEVFARQLQFQRELFEQLRTLRTPPAPNLHGEHDVSA